MWVTDWQSEERNMKLTRQICGEFHKQMSQFPTGFRSPNGVGRVDAVQTQRE